MFINVYCCKGSDSQIPSILKKNVFIFQNGFILSGPKIKRIQIQRDMDISQYIEAPVTDRSHSFYTWVYFIESPSKI